jgi:hypothetical protein
MALIMQRAIDIDETNNTSQEERINALLLENRGLKEILAVHENMQQTKPSTIVTTIPEVCFYIIRSHALRLRYDLFNSKR